MITTTKSNHEEETFSSSGERLSEILDKIGFKKGRGRVTEFHNFLKDKNPTEFEDLKYTAVRSWFQETTPPIKKIDTIISTLSIEFEIKYDISQLKSWWKLGGKNPFTHTQLELDSITRSVQEHKDNEEKFQFIVMSLITEEIGQSFDQLSSDDLISIKEFALEFTKNFADPFKTECPHEYIRIAIREKLKEIENKKSND